MIGPMEHRCEMCKCVAPCCMVRMVLENNNQVIARFHLCSGCIQEMLDTYKDVIKDET